MKTSTLIRFTKEWADDPPRKQAQIYTLERMLDSATTNPSDRQMAVAAMDYARAHGIETVARAIYLRNRRSWLDYLTITQRKWQAHTRRPTRARHGYEDIRTRDRYVRCAA
jgi:hypothetical protein